MIYKNEMGWETEDGMQVAFNEKFAFMNTARHPKHQRPIWKDANCVEDES